MDIKDFLGEYIKPQALKLGGEGAITDVEAGLDGFEGSVEQIQDWTGDSAILNSTEGNRTILLSQDDTKDMFIHGNNINFYKPLPGGGITVPNSVLMLAQNSLNLSVNGSGFAGSQGSVFLTVVGDGTVPSPIHGFTIENGSVVMRQLGGSTSGSNITMNAGRNMSIGTGFLTITGDNGLHLQTNNSNPNLNRVLIKNRSNTPGAITYIILGNEPSQDAFGGAPLPKSPDGLSIGTLWVDGTGASASLRIVMPE